MNAFTDPAPNGAVRTPTATFDPHAGAERALSQRLRAVAPVLLDSPVPDQATPFDAATDASMLLELLVEAVARHSGRDRIWLLLTAAAAAYPRRTDVDRLRRQLALLPVRTATIRTLEAAGELAAEAGVPDADLELVCDQVIVDVDHSARSDLHTGIQRVVRSLLPEWEPHREVMLTAWTGPLGALRRLDGAETNRVLHWSGADDRAPSTAAGGRPESTRGPHIVVPWRSVVVIPEVPPASACDRLGALADHSGNRLVGIFHDAIPVVSADQVPMADASKFVRFLTCVKFAHRMAGVSRSAASELLGFTAALRTQGLIGPIVSAVPLATPFAARPAAQDPGRSRQPSVLVVGSHEPRKNHLAVLHASELLWREGHDFALDFIGGSGWGDAFPRRAAELRAKGRPLQVRRAVSDAELDRAYRGAAFTVFPSLHEGFGLPVAESLAHGVPVITSNFGSTAEIGRLGGAMLIDPRDDHAIADAMRMLITDPGAVERLRAEIQARPERTWTDYAVDLWAAIVEPEVQHLRGTA